MAAKIYKINFKSDFVLTIQSDAGWAIPFCIKFWTGAPSKAYFVGYDGTNYHNCRIGETSDKLVVLFDDHHLPIGDLQMQIAYHTTIEDFPSVQFDEVTNPVIVKTEIDGQEYHVMLDFTGETAPEIEFSLPAYYNEQQRIANEQERERIFAEMQQAFATMQRESGAATAGAENVNATLNGTVLTVTDRTGHQTSSNVQGPPGPPGSGVQADWSETDPSADDYIKNKPTVYTQQQVDQKLAEKQNVITDLQTIRDNAADGKQALTDVTAVEQLIPAAATSQNKLADQGFVNSSVATNTAYYISDNGEPFTSLEALEAYSGPLTNNDFAFVVGTDSAGNTTYTRYKYNADTEQWAEEFVLNNSSFTAAQWAAIQSGITAALVGKLSDLPTNSELTALLAGKQDTISDLSTIRSGAQAGATAYQKPQAGIPKTDLAQGVQDSLDLADTALQEDTLYVNVNNNGHEYVDLGLPSGTLWAKCNVGADDETGYGNYYMYGKGARQYNSEDAIYEGTENPLDLSVDTARQVLGGSWRMPTQAQMQELVNSTTYEWVTINGINGGKFTAANGNYVFFPAVGWYDNGSQYDVGNYGYYWGSSTDGSFNAYFLSIDDGSVGNSGRKYGYSVRGVILPEKTQLKKDLDSKANKSEMSVVDGTGTNADKTTITLKDGTSATVLKSHQDISGKEDITTIESPVNSTDATLPITTLTCEVGKYYRIDVPIETLAVTLPAMGVVTSIKTVVIYLTGGTTPAVTITSADSKDVYYQDGYEIKAGKTYEVSCLYNGAAWVVGALTINTGE